MQKNYIILFEIYRQPIITKAITSKYSYSPTAPTDLRAINITGAAEMIDEYKHDFLRSSGKNGFFVIMIAKICDSTRLMPNKKNATKPKDDI